MRWMRWKFRCWRISHYRWQTYVAWYNHPCTETGRVLEEWNRLLDRTVGLGPQ